MRALIIISLLALFFGLPGVIAYFAFIGAVLVLMALTTLFDARS